MAPIIEMEKRMIGPNGKSVITERRLVGVVSNEPGMSSVQGAGISGEVLVSHVRKEKEDISGMRLDLDADLVLEDGTEMHIMGKQVPISAKGKGELNVSSDRTLLWDMNPDREVSLEPLYNVREVGEGESLRESQVRIVRTAVAKREAREKELKKQEDIKAIKREREIEMLRETRELREKGKRWDM